MENGDELTMLRSRIAELEERVRSLRTSRLVLMSLLQEREADYQRQMQSLERENKRLKRDKRLGANLCVAKLT